MTMIAEKIQRMYGVAETCRNLARKQGTSEDFQQQMFLLGWLHDIGYEFADSFSHGRVAFEILSDATNTPQGKGYLFSEEIRVHGFPDTSYERTHTPEGEPRLYPYKTMALDILNMADIITGPDGRYCSPQNRLAGIAERYGKDSKEFENMLALCKELKLF